MQRGPELNQQNMRQRETRAAHAKTTRTRSLLDIASRTHAVRYSETRVETVQIADACAYKKWCAARLVINIRGMIRRGIGIPLLRGISLAQ